MKSLNYSLARESLGYYPKRKIAPVTESSLNFPLMLFLYPRSAWALVFIYKMKSPAFAFYVRDWLCSRSVLSMSGDQVKAYIYLLSESWLQSPRATLPNDDYELASMARVAHDKWLAIKEPIMKQFSASNGGRLENDRLLEVSKISEIRSLNRINKTRTKVKQKNNKQLTAREDEDETNSSLKRGINKGEKNFEEFWKEYPRKKGKGAALKSWLRLSAKDWSLATSAIKQQKASLSEKGEFCPYPATWINQKRWLDEPDSMSNESTERGI